jgi:acyl-CoA-binding protein
MSLDLQESFDIAVQLASSPQGSKWPLTSDQKLTLYSCYKQVHVGDCTGDRPSMFNPVARQKYDSWKAVSGLKKADAMKRYIQVVAEFAPQVSSAQ